MKMKTKAKPMCALITRSVILLLIVIQLCMNGVFSEAGELCNCEPNLPPMPSIESDTPIDPGIIPPIDPGILQPIDPPGVIPPPIPPIPPIPPSIIRHPANCAIIGNSPNMLMWPSVPSAESYDVYLGKSKDFSESVLIEENVSGTFLAIEQDLEPGTYSWIVDVVTNDRVVDGIEWMFYVAMKAKDPYPANGITGVKLPLLQWTSDPNVVSQKVYLGTSDDFTDENLVAEPQEDFYFIPLDKQLSPGGELGMQPNTTYYWQLVGFLEDGTTVDGDVWSFTTEAETPSLTYPEPVAWWPFDENIGPVTKDAIGSRNGDIIGASWNLPTPPSISTSSALGFDGEHDWVEIHDVSGLFDDSFSISCWVNGGDAGQVIFSQQGGANWLMVSDSWGLRTELTEPALSYDEFPTFPAEWNNVCVTWDGGELILYSNGLRLISSGGPINVSFENPIYIGCGSNQDVGSFWNGVIDEVRIFDTVLTQEDLDAIVRRNNNIITDEYYTDLTMSKHVRIDLNYDKALGAVLSEQAVEATDEEITDFANSFGLGVVNIDRPNRIVELELPLQSPISRLRVAEFTRAAREVLNDESLFVELGLAVTPGAAETSILVNEQFTVQLAPDTSIEELIGDGRARVVGQNPFNPDEYLLEITTESDKDAMELANEYHLNSNAIYAVPNLAIVPEFRGNSLVQWHLNDETNDADIDAQEAWDFIAAISEQNPDVNVAVIDSRVDHEHVAFDGNRWTNPGEIAGNDIDDDNNLYKDDVHGCNFGYNNSLVHEHGTAVAGCIGANGTNPEGVCGSCPDCKLMFLRCNITTFDQHLAFDYARAEGADVICCSWGYKAEIEAPIDVKNSIFNAATFGRVRNVNGQFRALGCVIMFAMTNEFNDNGGFFPDISSLARVIAVSGSTDQDKCSGAGYGDIMEVLAPTSGGNLRITTTDIRDAKGYNYENKDPGTKCEDMDDIDYTLCFGGTSAACATTAGVAGLILSVEPDLYRRDVQRILQDTADKIDDSAGHYNPDNGYSTGSMGKSTHGYGRINAFEAVRVAAQGVDVFLRDNRLDWGNTSRVNNQNHYPEGNPISTTEFTSKAVEVTETENGVDVSVLVRNRGPIIATGVTVELYVCVGGVNPPDFFLSSDEWRLVEPETEGDNIVDVPYCGSSVAGLPTDPIKTVTFSLSNDSLNVAPGQHIYLLAMAYCDDDPISFDLTQTLDAKLLAVDDNNITMLKISWDQFP